MRRADNVGAGDIVVIAVPYSNHASILTDIKAAVAGKIVVDTTVPLMPPKVARVQLPAEGSAALIAQRTLGPGVTVVSAFHNVAAHKLATDEKVDCDVLVFGAGLSRPRGNRPPSRRIAEQAINCRRHSTTSSARPISGSGSTGRVFQSLQAGRGCPSDPPDATHREKPRSGGPRQASHC